MNFGYPRITIITPSLNQGQFLEQTILSVINQKYPNLEYIIIDGGSKDRSVNIIEKYEKSISFWSSENDSGQTNAINKGLQHCSGDIINWLNSDDILLPNVLNTIAFYYNRFSSYDIFFGDFGLINSNSTKLFIRKVPPFSFFSLLYGRQLSNQPAVFFSKDVIQAIGLLDESYSICMDQEFWVRAATSGFRFKPILKTLAISRIHSQCKTYKHPDLLKSEHKKICRKYGYMPFNDNSKSEEIFYCLNNIFWKAFSFGMRTMKRGDKTFRMVNSAYRDAK